MLKIIAAIALLTIATLVNAVDDKKDNLHMFPSAPEGYARHVIELPKTENDNDHKVELLIGKNMLVDCNRHSLSGKIDSVTLKGWGYKFLKVTDIRPGPSTLMACPDEKTERFVSMPGKIHRYNSRLPIVAYLPQGFELRYRIWSADKEIKTAVPR